MQRHVKTPVGDVLLRPQKFEDVKYIEAYLFDSDPDFLESIGFKKGVFTDRDSFRSRIEDRIRNTSEGELPVMMMAEFQGRAISHTWLEVGKETSNAHFHIYESELRGKGLGKILFKNALEILMDAHGVSRVIIEPKATNQRMIRLMEKCGFENQGPSIYKAPQVGELEAIRFLYEK